MRRINYLNEEIARWAFEILCKEKNSWHIAFTNPTAGPWKTIKAKELNSTAEGEVYRFILEEDRPDIIIYNDALKAIIIIEAKDTLEKLLVKEQLVKSTEVVIKLARILNSKVSNKFWSGRENYTVILGLLWGSTNTPKTSAEKNNLFDSYQRRITNKALVKNNLIIGIETLFHADSLACSLFYKNYKDETKELGQAIINSFKK